MQFGVYINQVKALEWGLNFQQAGLFAVVYEAQHWAESLVVAGRTYYNLSKGKIIDELPLLTDKKDTVYRLLKQLEEKGVLVCTRFAGKDYFLITDRGRGWNREPTPQPEAKSPLEPAANECGGEPHIQIPLACGHDSEKNPSYDESPEKPLINQREKSTEKADSEKNPNDGNVSDIRKNIQETSEKNPENLGKKSDESYNQDNNYQDQQRRLQRAREPFGMHWSWEPLDNFGERMQRSGILLAMIPRDTFTQIVSEFISYWSTRPEVRLRPDKWDHKLFQRIIGEHRKRTLYETRQQHAANPGSINWDSTSWIENLDLGEQSDGS